VLFVGIAPYTAHYVKILDGTDFLGMDKFSFKKPDILGDFCDQEWVKDHLQEYGTVILNGVI
jgi:hypothetical protein